MAEYIDKDDDTTKLIIFGIGIAAIGFIALVLYKGSCQNQPQYLSQQTPPMLQYPPHPYAMSSTPQNQPYYFPELHAIEHRLEKLEESKNTSKFDSLEQRLMSLETRIDELVKVSLNKVNTLKQEKPREPVDRNTISNVVSMSKMKPDNVKLTPAEHHTLMRNHFGMF